MKIRSRAVSALAALSLSAIALTACAGSSTGGELADDEPIVIGVSGPKTGNQAEYGKNWEEGFQIALDEINAAGGIQGHPVELDFQDSQGEASQATTIAQRFVSDESVLGVMGDFSSATSMVASPLYQRGGLVQLGITNSHPDFTETGDFIFATSVTQEVEGREVATKAGALGDKIAVIYLNNDWGSTAFDIIEEQIAADGNELVYSTAVEETSTDFRPQLLAARDAGADAIVYYTYYASTALLAQQADQAGLDIPELAVSSNYAPEFLELGGEAVEDIYLNTVFFPGSSDPEVQAFVDAFTEKWGYAPNSFAAYAYDGLHQLAWAAENAETLDRQGLRDALDAGVDIPSVIFGDSEFNDERRIDDPGFTWIQVQDGEFVETDDLD